MRLTLGRQQITAAHVRAARGFLAISQAGLAVFTGLSRITIRNVEAGGPLPPKSGAQITAALAELGVALSSDGLKVGEALS